MNKFARCYLCSEFVLMLSLKCAFLCKSIIPSFYPDIGPWTILNMYNLNVITVSNWANLIQF